MRIGTCQHPMSTLVETRGLGGWEPIEVYKCDTCGALHEINLLTTNNDEEN